MKCKNDMTDEIYQIDEGEAHTAKTVRVYMIFEVTGKDNIIVARTFFDYEAYEKAIDDNDIHSSIWTCHYDMPIQVYNWMKKNGKP